jgi:hypothetical protein
MVTNRFSQRQPGSSWARTTGKVVLGAIILAELIAIVFLLASTRHDDTPSASTDEVRIIGTQSGGRASYTSDEGAYTFDYPEGWKLQPDESITKVTSPDGDTVISIGPGPGADPLASSERLATRLRDAYSNVTVTDKKVQSFGSNLGIVLQGTATNERGVKLAFEAAAIQSSRGGLAVTGFTAGGPERLKGVFQGVLDSLEVESR